MLKLSSFIKNLTITSFLVTLANMNEQLTMHRAEAEDREQSIPVLVSGLPGRMATLVAESLGRNGSFELLPVALTSGRHSGRHIEIGDKTIFLSHDRTDNFPYWRYHLKGGTIAVDFTTPDSVDHNAERYVSARIPFVMGTTGGGREEIERMVRNSKISAVIAPNMAASVVEVQAELANLIETSPDHFRDWQMTIRESHQVAKRDVSGTARAFQAQLERLGAIMEVEIESVRDPEAQRQLGIKNVDGHAYHWITLTSPNSNRREFTTQIEGRQPYVEGTLMAIRFLSGKMREGSQGEVFSMMDVVRERREVTK